MRSAQWAEAEADFCGLSNINGAWRWVENASPTKKAPERITWDFSLQLGNEINFWATFSYPSCAKSLPRSWAASGLERCRQCWQWRQDRAPLPRPHLWGDSRRPRQPPWQPRRVVDRHTHRRLPADRLCLILSCPADLPSRGSAANWPRPPLWSPRFPILSSPFLPPE